MKRAIGFAVCVVLAAACGGTSSGKASAPPTTTTMVESAETQAWVTAATTGLMSDPGKPKNLTDADATCLAHALVDTLSVARLKAAGATLSDMRNPSYNPPASFVAGLSPAVKLAVGGALQACRFGTLIGPVTVDSIAQSIGGGYQPDATATQCVSAWFEASAQRALVADMVLAAEPSAADSDDLAHLMVDCLDIGAMMAPTLHLTLSPAERTCINTAARTDTQFIAAMSADISGASASADSPFALFGARTVKCLTPENIVQLGKNDAGG